MTVTLRHRVVRACARILFAYSGFCSVGLAANLSDEAPKPLPLGQEEYQAFVQKLASAANGNETVLAEKLRALRFSCTSASKTSQFSCIRFGCQRGGFLMRGSLLQWSVDRADWIAGGLKFSGSVTNYSWLKGCYSKGNEQKAQEDFLTRHFSKK